MPDVRSLVSERVALVGALAWLVTVALVRAVASGSGARQWRPAVAPGSGARQWRPAVAPGRDGTLTGRVVAVKIAAEDFGVLAVCG